MDTHSILEALLLWHLPVTPRREPLWYSWDFIFTGKGQQIWRIGAWGYFATVFLMLLPQERELKRLGQSGKEAALSNTCYKCIHLASGFIYCRTFIKPTSRGYVPQHTAARRAQAKQIFHVLYENFTAWWQSFPAFPKHCFIIFITEWKNTKPLNREYPYLI